MKRLFDIVFSFLGLLFLAPLFASIALALLITSGEPAIFSQVRVGRDGTRFTMRKFRTMKVNPGVATGGFEPGDRSRITPFGRLLRMSKLDELPQLWNVFKGEMSIVGPRPEVPQWIKVYPERWKHVLMIKPGITDPASLIFRDEESILARSDDPWMTYKDQILPRKLRIYEDYASENTVRRDLCIVLETLGQIVSDNLNKAR